MLFAYSTARASLRKALRICALTSNFEIKFTGPTRIPWPGCPPTDPSDASAFSGEQTRITYQVDPATNTQFELVTPNYDGSANYPGAASGQTYTCKIALEVQGSRA